MAQFAAVNDRGRIAKFSNLTAARRWAELSCRRDDVLFVVDGLVALHQAAGETASTGLDLQSIGQLGGDRRHHLDLGHLDQLALAGAVAVAQRER